MRIVSVSEEYMRRVYAVDQEAMRNTRRPCLLVLRLRFRGRRRDFAVPFRSNIAPNAPKDQYFPLPPRPSTRPRHRHGIHYIKMFPVDRRQVVRFRVEGNDYYEMLARIVERNERRIIAECEEYLDRYEKLGKPVYAVDIDRVLAELE